VVLSDKNQLSQSSPTEVNLHLFKKLIKLENVFYSGRGKFMPLSPKSKVLETNIS
jgi:hypothetical protein